MSPETVGYIGLGLMLVLLFLRVWVGLAMAVIGFVGILIIQGWDPAAMIIGRMPYQIMNSYEYSVMPMFMLMGMVVADSRIGSDIYDTARAWLGQIRGGLGHATVFACAAIAAITGGTATGITVTCNVALPEMEKSGYNKELGLGILASAATMGIMIPPSMGFILYGIITQLSIGKLFMAGILPGLTQGIFYMITIYLLCRWKPSMGPAGPKTSFKEKIFSLKKTWTIALLFILVMGGIYGGIFTPTEAGAVGAFGACVIAIALRRFNRKSFLNTIANVAALTAMVLLILVGTSIFMKFMAVSEVPFQLSNFVSNLHIHPILVMVVIIVFYIVLGTALPEIPLILITVPILYPLVLTMNFDPFWFGVILVRMMEIGSISPPYGTNIFVLSAMTGVPEMPIYRGVLPFLITDVFHTALLVGIPGLALWLPNMMN